MTQLELRYAPGKKTFTVQSNRQILAVIPTTARKDFVTIQGQTYAVTPQMYARAACFRHTPLDLPVTAAEVVKAKVSAPVNKVRSKAVNLWRSLCAALSFKGVFA